MLTIAQPERDYAPGSSRATRDHESQSPSPNVTNSTWQSRSKTVLEPKNRPPAMVRTSEPIGRNIISRIVTRPDGTIVSGSQVQNYAPYRTVTPVARVTSSGGRQVNSIPFANSIRSNSLQNRPVARAGQSTGQSNPTNVRITKQVLESILKNPDRFTQINNDQVPEMCNYLKVRS